MNTTYSTAAVNGDLVTDSFSKKRLTRLPPLTRCLLLLVIAVLLVRPFNIHSAVMAGASLQWNYYMSASSFGEVFGGNPSGGCHHPHVVTTNLTANIAYHVSFATTRADYPLQTAAVDLIPPCGYYDTYTCDSGLGTLAHSISVSLVPIEIVFGFDRPKNKGRYSLPADGRSKATPHLNRPNAGSLNWSIVGQDLGAKISSSGVVTAGTRTGTIKVHAQDNLASLCYDEELDLVDCDSACPGGNCGSSMGRAEVAVRSVDIAIPLGWSVIGGTAGHLRIKEEQPFQVSPAKLSYDFVRLDSHVIRESGVLRQIKSSHGLANITNISDYRFAIDFYDPTNAGPIPISGPQVYYASNAPFASIIIENPGEPPDTNKVRVVHTQEGVSVTNDFTKITDGWELISGNALRKETQTTVWSETNTLRTVTTTIMPGGGSTVLYQKIEKFRTNTLHHWERLEQEIIGTAAYRLTNTYSWLTNAYLEQVVRSDGSWESYVYDSENRPTKVLSTFKNASLPPNTNLCRVLYHDYSTNVISTSGDTGNRDTTTPRRTIETIQGYEVARSYFVSLPGERRQIHCVTMGAPWNDASNLVTTNRYFTNGFYQNELSSFSRPNGTGEVYQYGLVEVRTTNFNTTNLVLVGHIDTTGTNIDRGVTNMLVYDWSGLLLSKTVIDAPSGIVIATEVNEYDSRKRLTKTTFLDGTSVAAGFFDCCLGSVTTNRDGTVVTVTNDVLHRVMTTTQNGITLSHSYDAVGNLLSVVRHGTNGTAITVQNSTYDDAGRLTSTSDGLGNPTLYTNYVEASGQVVRQTTYPHTGTRIETYYRDGSLKSVHGTAVHGVAYDYGPVSDGTRYVFESKLSGGSETDEWVWRVTDMAGRPTDEWFSDGSVLYRTYAVNASAERDPDGVVSLFLYNSLGELEDTVLDLNRDFDPDYLETDRITRTVSDVITNSTYGTNVRRTRTYVWNTEGSAVSNLLSTVETSVNGLSTWNTFSNAGVAVVSSVRTAYTNGHRYVTHTAFDGTYIVQDFLQGRLISETRKDTNGNQITAITYTYDPHGRVLTAVDARNGPTTFAYDNNDRQTSITISNQTTLTHYNSMGWVTNVVPPDSSLSGSIRTEYHLTWSVFPRLPV